jgi:hypothetical protein
MWARYPRFGTSHAPWPRGRRSRSAPGCARPSRDPSPVRRAAGPRRRRSRCEASSLLSDALKVGLVPSRDCSRHLSEFGVAEPPQPEEPSTVVDDNTPYGVTTGETVERESIGDVAPRLAIADRPLSPAARAREQDPRDGRGHGYPSVTYVVAIGTPALRATSSARLPQRTRHPPSSRLNSISPLRCRRASDEGTLDRVTSPRSGSCKRSTCLHEIPANRTSRSLE